MSAKTTYEILRAKYAPDVKEAVADERPIDKSYAELLALYELILKGRETPAPKLEGAALMEYVLKLTRESQAKKGVSIE
jgi:hypothetical protein